MGKVVDYIPAESLDRRTQHLTQAEIDVLADLLPESGLVGSPPVASGDAVR
ncbi:hypothetical protein [Spongiactinospora rosea]|uniref:hypothetical protein n=1 Tax=Spongiactinospora rosea TaxID=2248750 RepID=UPI0013145ECC|nr:hypothetical protein [Spongiactinospora rosea]